MNIEIAFEWIQTAKTTTHQTLWLGRKNHHLKMILAKKIVLLTSISCTMCMCAPYHCIMFNVNCNVCDEKQYVPNAYHFCNREKTRRTHTHRHTYTYQNVSSNFVKITSSILHLTSPQWTKKRKHTQSDVQSNVCSL